MPQLVTNLWFDNLALEAAEFYVSVFPNSEITDIAYYGEAGPGPAGTVVTVAWELDGHRFAGINGGPQFTFDEAVSVEITCEDQAEVDYYWDRLREGGGEESMCGWLKDRYGFSWQVVPRRLIEMLTDPDREAADRATKAMLGMRKLDIAQLESAFAG